MTAEYVGALEVDVCASRAFSELRAPFAPFLDVFLPLNHSPSVSSFLFVFRLLSHCSPSLEARHAVYSQVPRRTVSPHLAGGREGEAENE